MKTVKKTTSWRKLGAAILDWHSGGGSGVYAAGSVLAARDESWPPRGELLRAAEELERASGGLLTVRDRANLTRWVARLRELAAELYPAAPARPTVDELAAYELGELDEDDVVDLFQRLLDSGLIWALQGHYHRTASDLIRAGRIVRR